MPASLLCGPTGPIARVPGRRWSALCLSDSPQEPFCDPFPPKHSLLSDTWAAVDIGEYLCGPIAVIARVPERRQAALRTFDSPQEPFAAHPFQSTRSSPVSGPHLISTGAVCGPTADIARGWRESWAAIHTRDCPKKSFAAQPREITRLSVTAGPHCSV